MAAGSWMTRSLPGLAAALMLIAGAPGALVALRGCDQAASGDVAVVKVGGKTFHLEIAADPQVRLKGLSGRTHIEPDGGMLFVFPRSDEMYFVMRDCPIPIDILFLDPAGRVVAAHEMQPETARTEEEKKLSPPYPDAPEWQWSNQAYESRLKKYPSKFSAQFAVELASGRIKQLGVKEGDQVATSDAEALKKRAK